MGLFTAEIKHDVEAQSRVRAWIERLKSGQDQQSRMELHHRNGSFCCLGLAVDEYARDGWELNGPEQCYEWRGEYLYLPPDVIAAYCLRDAYATFGGSPEEPGKPPLRSLVQLNSSRTFAEIGEFIEQQLNAALAA